MRHRNGEIPRDLVSGVIGDFQLDGVNPSFPRAGAFGAQINSQVASDPPIGRSISVAVTIDGFVARDRHNLAADFAASVGRLRGSSPPARRGMTTGAESHRTAICV